MSVKERLKEYLEHKNIRPSVFCRTIGVSEAYINSIRKSILPDKLESIALNYPDLNIDWLLTGSGEKIKSDRDFSGKERTEDLTTQKTNGVPYYDIDISASITESFNDVREKPEFYVDFKYFNDCTAYLPIWGDSMYPAYASGEIIAVKRINNPDIIQWGEAYLVITSAEANNMKTVKLLFPHEESDKIILRASNPNFKGDTVIPKSSILSLYIVKGKITRKQL